MAVVPPDRIIDLIKATGDSELLEFFCEPCGFIPVRTIKGKPTPEEREKDQIMLSILMYAEEADSVGAISYGVTGRVIVLGWMPAPANITGTNVSYCHGEPWVDATVSPSKSLMNTFGSNTR